MFSITQSANKTNLFSIQPKHKQRLICYLCERMGMWFWPLRLFSILQVQRTSESFHFILKKTATLMENVDRTQNVNSHNKNNESTNVKIAHKKI